MSSPRSQLIELIEQGAIPADRVGEALRLTKIAPDARAWRTFIDHLLLWLGGLALAFAVMFFVAYNWADIGRFAKFGMVEGLIVLAIGAYCRFSDHEMAGKVALLGATICLGVLLALYGQTYQTGADTWQLFFTWAMLMLPWAIIGRFPAIWILWVALINTSIVLYYQTFLGIFGFMFADESGMLWLLFLVNTFLLAVWELLAARVWPWLAERWAIRLLAIAGGVSLTWLVLRAIFDSHTAGLLPGLAWPVWLGGMYLVYRRVRADLFMLAGCCLSVITVSVSLSAEHLLKNTSSGAFLLLALQVIVMGGGAAIWLKNVHQELLS